MGSCYTFKTLLFNKPLFPLLDHTFIITMHNSSRIQNCLYQLQKYPFTSNVTFVFNKGFKNCHKYHCHDNACSTIDVPYKDIVHANKYIMNYSIQNNFNNILILEDDFICSTELNTTHSKICQKFIHHHKFQPLIFYMGTIPHFSLAFGSKSFRKVFLSTGTHAVIYNNLSMKHILSNNFNDIDLFLSSKNRFAYYLPLVYQIFPQTDNQQYWGSSNYLLKPLSKLLIYYLNSFGLDKHPEPGTSRIYRLNRVFDFIYYFILFAFLYLISKYFLAPCIK